MVVLFFGREGVPGAWCLVKKIEGLGEDLWGLEKKVPHEEGIGSFPGEGVPGGWCLKVPMEVFSEVLETGV